MTLALLSESGVVHNGNEMLRWLLLLVLLFGVTITGCRHGRPNTAISLSSPHPDMALDAVVFTMRQHDWPIVEFDGQRGFVRGQAKVGRGEWKYSWGKVRPTDNFILVQVYVNGQVDVWAAGELVRDNGAVVHDRLAAEVNQFVAELEEALSLVQRGGAVPRRGSVVPVNPASNGPPPPPPQMLPRPYGY
jgi:hypothetical protein